MADTQIEILAITDRVRAAFYYPVPQVVFLPASEDQSRVPAGIRLLPNQLQDLKDGTLFEFIVDEVKPPNVTVQQIQNALIQRYDADKTKARLLYQELYTSDNLAWDGQAWT